MHYLIYSRGLLESEGAARSEELHISCLLADGPVDVAAAARMLDLRLKSCTKFRRCICCPRCCCCSFRRCFCTSTHVACCCRLPFSSFLLQNVSLLLVPLLRSVAAAAGACAVPAAHFCRFRSCPAEIAILVAASTLAARPVRYRRLQRAKHRSPRKTGWVSWTASGFRLQASASGFTIDLE